MKYNLFLISGRVLNFIPEIIFEIREGENYQIVQLEYDIVIRFLKYFEYLYGELKIIAVDFPAHRDLPFSENISYFQENDTNSFLYSLIKTQNMQPIKKVNLESISLDFRAKKIIKFFK